MSETNGIALALWANEVQRACLLEAGDDVEGALAAAEYIVATQPLTKKTIQPVFLSITDSDYPRDNANRFLSKYVIAECARNPECANKTRESLPEWHRPKFDALVARLQMGGTIHHPKEPPGLAIDVNGNVADPKWAAYADAVAARDAWEMRESARDQRCGCASDLTKLTRGVKFPIKLGKQISALHDDAPNISIKDVRERADATLIEYTDHLDEVDRQLKDMNAPPAQLRQLARLRHQSEIEIDAAVEAYVAQIKKTGRGGAPPIEQERLSDRFDDLVKCVQSMCREIDNLHEEIAESIHAQVESERAGDPEIEVPEEPGDENTQNPHLHVALGMVGDEWHGPNPPKRGNWVAIAPGPRGGKRWRRGGDGDTPPEQPPGGGQPGAVAPGKAGKSAKPEKPKKLTVDEVHNVVKQATASGKPVTPEDVAALAQTIAGLSVKDMTELKKCLELKASGNKAEFAKKLAERALGGGDGEKQPKQAKQPEATGAEKHVGVIAGALAQAKHIPDEQKKSYLDASKTVIGNMNEKALALYAKGVGPTAPTFYSSPDELTAATLKLYPAISEKLKGNRVAGMYQPGIGGGKLHLDGKSGGLSGKSGEFDSGGNPVETYAHEMAHAIDGPNGKLSKSRQWQAAYKAELKDGALTNYAATDHIEGFAEFGRAMLSGKHERSAVKAAFPKCFDFWVKQGLAEDVEANAGGERVAEVFSEKIPVDDKGTHADIGLTNPATKSKREPNVIGVAQAMASLDRSAHEGSTVSIEDLRKEMGLPHEQFNELIMQLAIDGVLDLHHHVTPGGLSDEEKMGMIKDPNSEKGRYFIGAALRPDDSSAADAIKIAQAAIVPKNPMTEAKPQKKESKKYNQETKPLQELKDVKIEADPAYADGDEEAYQQQQAANRQEMFGEHDPATFAAAVCAVDGATVMAGCSRHYQTGEWVADVEMSHEGISTSRQFNVIDGELVVSNNSFNIDEESPYKGRGAELFANQVQGLRKLGVKKIVTCAANGIGMNGYYTWARCGYSGTIEDNVLAKLPEDIRAKMGDSRDILDLMALPGGPEAWKEDGSSLAMTFDLSDGSRNLKALSRYLEERKSRNERPKQS